MGEARAATGGGSFLRELVRQVRAQDAVPSSDGRTDWEVLEPFLRAPRRRRDEEPDPDPEAYWRLEVFYCAVAAAVEQRSGVACEPMLRMHHEGFGRIVLLAGRLVVLSRFVREVQRFGFDSVETLSAEGEKLVAESVEAVERFPDVARWV